MSALVKRCAVFRYYVLVFAISWGAIFIVVGPGGFVSTTATSPTFPLVGLASLLGPSLAGVMMTGLVDGRAGFRSLLWRLLRWQVGVRWYIVAFLTAPLLTLATLIPLSFASTAFLPSILTADDKASLLLTGVATGLIVAVFEELGWTGFATPRLRQRHGILATGLIMGLLWGAWHFPLFAGSTGSSGELPPTLFLASMLFSWLVPYRVLMVWVYDRTGSVLMAMAMHVPIVVSQYVLTPQAISGKEMFISLLAYTGVLWFVVGAVVLRNGRRHESAL